MWWPSQGQHSAESCHGLGPPHTPPASFIMELTALFLPETYMLWMEIHHYLLSDNLM